MKNDDKDNFNAGLAYADYKQARVLYILAALAAFLMSSYFMVSYATGGIDFDKWGAMEWKYAITAIMVTAVMTGFQFRLYGNGDMKNGGKVGVLAVIVAVAFSLLSEVGQGMERDEVRMETKSQESPTYQAALAALGNSATASYNPYSSDLQAAEVKLAQCQARLAQGKEKHCEGSAARVEAVNKMIAQHATASQQQAAALLAQAKSMEKDESNYFPIVGVIIEWLGVSGKTASLLFSVIIISMFEYAFHFLGKDFNNAKQKLMQHGYDVTRKLRQPPRHFDGSISTYSDRTNESAPVSAFTSGANSARQTVSEYAATIEAGLQASPEIIANEYGRAQHAREQLHSAIANKGGNMADESRQRFFKLLYAETRARILNGGIQPTTEDVKNLVTDVIKQHSRVLGLQPNLAGKSARNQIAKKILEKLADEGVIHKTSDGYSSDAPEIKTASGFKQSPDQAANVSKLYQDSLKDHAAGKVFNDAPTPPIKRMSVSETINALLDAVKKSGAKTEADIQAAVFDGYSKLFNPAEFDDQDLLKVAAKIAKSTAPATPAPAMPYNQRTGATGLHNPALGTAEEHYSLPLPTTTPDYQKGGEAAVKQSLRSFYIAWKAAVVSGSITTAERPFQQMAREFTDLNGISARALKPVWDEFGARAAREGVLVLNPEYQEGNRKLKYLRVV